MYGQPSVAFFVRAVVVQNHVQFQPGRGLRYHLVHKLQELLAPFELGEGRLDVSRRYLQSRKEVERPMALIGASVGSHDFAVVGFHVARLALQGLDAGLFIDTNHQRLFRRVEIQPYDVRRFGDKLLVGAHTPRALTLQTDAFPAQYPPNRMHRPFHGTGHRRPVPTRLARRGRLLQQRQNPIPKGFVVPPLGSRSWRIAQTPQPLADKSLAPLDHGIGTRVALAGDLLDPLAAQTAQNDPRSFDHLFRFGPARGQPLQLSPILRTTTDCGRSSRHAPSYIIYR